MNRCFMTRLPDKSGAFLTASRIILRHGGNMTRASYNKAVDAHTLFVDVEAEESALGAIEAELAQAGFLETESRVKVLLIETELPDEPGAVIPVLEVLSRHAVSISYLSSQSTGGRTVRMKMGLYIEAPEVIGALLEEMNAVHPVRILTYDAGEKKLDNTVFYLTLAEEMRQLLSLTPKETQEFIYYANLVMQQLDDKGEPHSKTFEYVSRFAHFVAAHGGAAYDCRITRLPLTERVQCAILEPPCGSNVTVLEDARTGELLVVDGGFACYQDITLQLLRTLFPGFDTRRRRMLLTHSDSDHTGICGAFEEILCTGRTADCFAGEHMGLPCPREENQAMLPYYRLSKLITRYEPPRMACLRRIDTSPGDDAAPISPVGRLSFGDLDFTVYQGNGGHVPGETMLMDEMHRIAITGDDYINMHDLTPPQRDFNRLAPYLARSVNQDSARYREILKALKAVFSTGGWLILPGHGAVIRPDAP